jgi:DNA-binding NarL/FixJ family response regulator
MAIHDESVLERPAPRRARVFVVDDNPLVRRGFRLLLSVEPDLVVCGEAEGEGEAFTGILLLQPDLAVVDLSLREGSGLELIKRLRCTVPQLKILVFSLHNEPPYVQAARQAGADDFVPKEQGPGRGVRVIRALLQGRKAGQLA